MNNVEYQDIFSDPDQMLLGFHFMDYITEDGEEGKVFEIGFLLFKINFYLE